MYYRKGISRRVIIYLIPHIDIGSGKGHGCIKGNIINKAFSHRICNFCSLFRILAGLQHEHGLRLAEVPITADYVDKPKRPVVAHGLMVLNGVLRLVGQYRPLFFFGLAGLFLLLVGTGWGWWVVVVYGRTKQLAIGYALISVLLTVLGSLSLFSGIMLHSVRGLLLDVIKPQIPS